MDEFDVIIAYVDDVCKNCGQYGQDHLTEAELGFGKSSLRE